MWPFTSNRIDSSVKWDKFPSFDLKEPQRNLCSSSAQTEYRLEPSGLPLESFHARDIYKEAVNSVEPRHMVENVLQFDEQKCVLTVEDKSYKLHRNVYVVGFGKAVLGMARATEDILGEHVVSGILSIPRGQRQILKEKDKGDLLLSGASRIEVYEGGKGQLPDSTAHRAALAIEALLSTRKDTDLIIMLISGGGSGLLPCPQEGISLEDLVAMTMTMYNSGASVSEVNTLRKNVERLKGGKAVDVAYPAKMVSLIISDVVGDPINLIASGPTVHDEVNAHQCFDILSRLGLQDKMPASILQHLRRQMADEASRVRTKPGRSAGSSPNEEVRQRHKALVQNVLVGSNHIACEAAAARAVELGHKPYILTTCMKGEARDIGATLARLGTFMLLCFDRRQVSHLALLPLELALVKAGVSKRQVNDIATLVDTAANMGRNAVIISGGEGVVHVRGTGLGGRNLELALGASLQLQDLFQLSKARTLPAVTLISADTDGEDGACPATGAVITENFCVDASLEGISCEEYLNNNDSYSAFQRVKGGSHLVVTRMTGTNVMDIQVLIVRNPLRSNK
ncbi:hypothetical protein ACOMHN_043372 [Nucella lapillus]